MYQSKLKSSNEYSQHPLNSKSMMRSNVVQRVLVSHNCDAPQVHDAATLGTFIHGKIAENYLMQGNPGHNQIRCAEKRTTGGNYRADIGTIWTATVDDTNEVQGNLARQGEIKPETQVAAGMASIDNVAGDNLGGAAQVEMDAWADAFNVPLGFNTNLNIRLRNDVQGYKGLYIYDCQ